MRSPFPRWPRPGREGCTGPASCSRCDPGAGSAGQAVPSDPVLAAWAKATDADLQELTQLAQRAKSGVPAWFMDYRVAEQEATSLRLWAPLVVPGLLQTPGYATSLLSARRRTPEQLKALGRRGRGLRDPPSSSPTTSRPGRAASSSLSTSWPVDQSDAGEIRKGVRVRGTWGSAGCSELRFRVLR